MSPTVFRTANLRFMILTRDHRPAHVHVYGPGAEAKIQLLPAVKVVESHGFSKRALKEILEAVKARREDMLEAWNEIHE